MPRPQKYTDEEIIAALREMKGMVYLAAAKIGCEADTIYRRAKKSRAVAAVMRSERGKVVDTAELKLHQGILRGEPWAVQFALKTIGKDRGYVEKQIVEQEGETRLVIVEEVTGDGPPEDGPPPPGPASLPSE